MMGGDPSLGKHLNVSPRAKFWVRTGQDDSVIVICAEKREQLLRLFPGVDIFEPEADWQAGHQGELFREYDIDKDREELNGLLT